ncbi:MAG: Gfo/Idh/MocA family oxidoreductase [Verrucomicrobia bacterium]|nr:Gfo/Idh/MocA family oxidoreductase [Verrucomicrobiota bacterium]
MFEIPRDQGDFPGMKNPNRRKFIKSAVAAVSAPFILPSRVWSAETPASERITLGFIGVGKQNGYLMRNMLQRKETQVVAVCEVDTTRRENAQKTVNENYAKKSGAGSSKGCDAYKDFRELLQRKDIDAVVIATPDHWHAIIAISAANAGKDIYCEKPLSQSIHQARAMVNAVRKNDRIFQTGSMQRSSSEFRIACELVRNGRIGKITSVNVGVGGSAIWCDLPAQEIEPGLDWNMWLGPAPERAYNEVLSPRGVHDHFPAWRNYREYGGGGVTDWGAHHFDIAQWGLGRDQSGPVEIIPAAASNADHGVKLIYDDGVEVNHDNGNGITFNGAGGKVNVNRGKFEFWIGDQKKAESRGDLTAVEREYLADAKVRLYSSPDHIGDWLSAIRTRKRPICDVEVGARTVSVCHLVNLAYYHHEKMKWNPQTETFVGNTGNAAWLDVPHRAPWKLPS